MISACARAKTLWGNLCRATSAKAAGANTARKPSSITAKKMSTRRSCCCAQLCGRRGLPAADVERVLHWSNYSAKAVAQIQARGMPIDMALWNFVQENKAAVIGELLRHSIRVMAATIRSTRRMASGAMRASSNWLDKCRRNSMAAAGKRAA